MAYAELHCLSNFTFLRGASRPEELVRQAASLGYAALALTDECSVAGVVRAHEVAREAGIRLIIGSEFHLSDGLRLVLLAPDRLAYAQLCQLITRGRRQAAKGSYHLSRTDLGGQQLDHCLALWQPGLWRPDLWQGYARQPSSGETEEADGRWLARQFPGRLWVLTERLLNGQDQVSSQGHAALARRLNLPLVCAGNVHMHVPERQPLLDTLTAIRLGCQVRDLGDRTASNREQCLRPLAKLARLYPAALMTETLRIANRCTFSLDELRYTYPEDLVPPGLTARQHLRQLVRSGLNQRYPRAIPLQVQRLIDKELQLIHELGYEHYFLTIHDIVGFARCRKILCQGRGSAANSAVCYCLGITEVDPTRVAMLFERFISRERNEPPDIDVDFEHERREEVIQYIYRKYGRDRAALAATVITYRTKSAMRDVGKALGLDLQQLEYWIGRMDWRDRESPWSSQLAGLGADPASPLIRRFIALVEALRGFPRHLSQHVGGFVIAAGQLTELVPVENAAMADRTVIQWDKDDLEALGLLKVDILALGMLSAVRRCLDLVSDCRGKPLTLADIPREDPAVYRLLQQADSVGIFQVESRAQMSMLPRLKPACYYDLVIQVAIVRPGPIQGEMVHPYLRRRQGIEPVNYPNDAVKAVLERTLGVPLFQEQVIKLAMVAAGFSAGEADQLRRAMASWSRNGRLEEFQNRLMAGMQARGHSETFAHRICQQIKGFGEYGFPESHAASFALLVYLSAWLKCHEPAAFTCALLNSQPMGFYSADQLIQDVRRHEVVVLPVTLNDSGWDHRLDSRRMPAGGQPAIRLGFRLVKGLRRRAAEALVARRPAEGFTCLSQLTALPDITRGDRDALAAAGALQALAGHRHQARWEMLGIAEQMPLFGDQQEPRTVIQLPPPAEGDDIREDYASLGLTLGRHPLCLLREQQCLKGCTPAAELQKVPHGYQVKVAGIVVGRQRPGSASGVTFVTLEDESGNVNIIVWRKTARAQRQPLLTARLLQVDGKLERQGQVIHVIARKLTDRTAALRALKVKSRDFH